MNQNREGSSASASLEGAANPPGLADVTNLPLTKEHQRVLDRLAEDMQGSAVWRQRKLAEAHGLIALSQIAPRLVVKHVDLRTELIALVELKNTPVPVMAPGASDIQIVQGAVLVIHYPEELLIGPIPGTQPIRILEPHNGFHTNVSYGDPVQALCLGANVPRGFPLREMALTSYAALTPQSISLNAMDPVGVLNGDAARWWQANARRIPLTTEPFLGLRRGAAVRQQGEGGT